MLFKNSASALRSFTHFASYSFGAHAHKVTNVIQTKHNPLKQKQLRGLQQFQLHMGDYQKQFYNVHKKQRKPLALYNLFSYLPTSITNQFANLVSDPKVEIASDQILLPKISQNSVPVYESLSGFSSTLITINKLLCSTPFMILGFAHMPWIATIALGMNYFIYFKSSYGLATQRFVVKMEILPETEQLIYQKITKMGCVRTSRVSLSDIESVNPQTQPEKYTRDLVFERAMRNSIDINMIFRIKSTGQYLMFDPEGVWHEQGLNHELMP